MRLASYPKVKAWGHKELQPLLERPVYVEEKVDGSQFSFGDFEDELHIRSKGAVIIPDAPPKLFGPAVETVRQLFLDGRLNPDWTYRAEAVCTPRHNTLVYDRIPTGGLVLFNIDRGNGDYLTRDEAEEEAVRLGLEHVPLFAVLTNGGCVKHSIDTFLEQESFLGGSKIEGFVVKPVEPFFDWEGKLLVGKYVSEAFKEVHHKVWKNNNPTSGDVVTRLVETYATEARWQKSIQHLDEQELLTHDPRDIGKLVKAIQTDTLDECEEEMKEFLWRHHKKEVVRRLVKGFPEWYKRKLAKGA